MINKYETIHKIIEQIKNKKILVIGDVMLDKYYYGDVKRISPEAPVPVVAIRKQRQVLGGAANVASNLKSLGCKVVLIGVVGEDESKSSLEELLEDKSIEFHSLTCEERQTITKTRVIGLNQQMMRLDFEDSKAINEKNENMLLQLFLNVIEEDIDTVIISDYAKGVCTPKVCNSIIKNCEEKGITTIIDPKGDQWNKYTGADYITPNVKELGDVIGENVSNEDEIIEKYGKTVKENYKIKNIVVTRSERGMSLINDNKVIHIPTVAREVFDVSGAGDTVVATLAALVDKKIDVIDALEVANISAGFVVSKSGTYSINSEELMEACKQAYGFTYENKKVIDRKDIIKLVENIRKNNKTIVFTNGCFDILHIGHVDYLKKASELADVLILGLNSDESVKRLKGETRPINNENDRASMLAVLSFIDNIIIFEEDTPKNLIKAIKPDILVKGGDYKAEEVVGSEYCGRVEIIPFVSGYSTTKIINNILSKK